MNSVLMCGACGRRCGVARRGDDGRGPDRIVVEFRNRGEDKNGKVEVNDTVWDATPAIWSLTLFTCAHCGAVLRLTRDRAKTVGRERRIILPVSTPR